MSDEFPGVVKSSTLISQGKHFLKSFEELLWYNLIECFASILICQVVLVKFGYTMPPPPSNGSKIVTKLNIQIYSIC